MSIISVGQVFGHEDLMASRKYSTTVRCLSNEGLLYRCKAEEFLARVSRDDMTWKILNYISTNKDYATLITILKNVITKDKREMEEERVKEARIKEESEKNKAAQMSKTLTVPAKSRNM